MGYGGRQAGAERTWRGRGLLNDGQGEDPRGGGSAAFRLSVDLCGKDFIKAAFEGDIHIRQRNG